ncbi:hypothetical protein [Sphingobacterium mizutaii]|uniref:hypothetical protein n=1 Tax=Sphingobacterium mizutaii TaxID=1010 RepID=UPI001625F189|nr:hypothetical protein [Sphingobacterium mizutaii]
MSSTEPLKINYLVFDDEGKEFALNQKNVKSPGIECNVIFFNPNDYYDALNDEFKINEFIVDIKQKIEGKYISLVASDWNMLRKTANYPEVNALQIIQILLGINDKHKKTHYLIYSGNPSEVSTVLIDLIKNELEKKNEPIYSKELLSLLLELKIKFSSRGERFTEIQTLIKSSKTISLILLNSLSSFEKLKLHNTGNECFDGRSIEELLDLIAQNNDLGLKFIREFIEMSIANYTDLNE